jgi:hypothetical protein
MCAVCWLHASDAPPDGSTFCTDRRRPQHIARCKNSLSKVLNKADTTGSAICQRVCQARQQTAGKLPYQTKVDGGFSAAQNTTFGEQRLRVSLEFPNTPSNSAHLYTRQKVRVPTYLSAMILKASAEKGSSSAGLRVMGVSGSSTAEPCRHIQQTAFGPANDRQSHGRQSCSVHSVRSS